MSEKNYYRPVSPYTFIEEFNKKINNEDRYPKSENPNLFVWNLEYQKLNPVKIPPQMVDKHLQKIRYEHQQLMGRKINENVGETQNLVENKSLKGISLIPLNIELNYSKSPTFKERRHNYSVSNLIRSPQDHQDRKNHTFSKILSNIPVSVLEKFQEQKERNLENLFSARTQSQSRRHITPIVNQSVTKEIYNYMAFDPLQPKKNEDNRIKTQDPLQLKINQSQPAQLKKMNSSQNLRSPNKDISENGKNSNREESNLSQNANPKEQFRFKNSKELNQFNEKADNKIKIPRPDKQIKPITLPHKLEQKFSIKNPHQSNLRIDDRKNFFNYRKYCYLNYKDAKSGLKMDLSKDCLKTLEKFEQTILNYMGEQQYYE